LSQDCSPCIWVSGRSSTRFMAAGSFRYNSFFNKSADLTLVGYSPHD
jgi:hypothetical protein